MLFGLHRPRRNNLARLSASCAVVAMILQTALRSDLAGYPETGDYDFEAG